MSEWVRLGPASALPEGQAVRIDLDDLAIALFHIDGQFYAIDDVCHHFGGPLSEGRIDDRVVTCPWHGWRFDLTSGARVDQSGYEPMRVYPVRLEDGWLYIAVEDEV